MMFRFPEDTLGVLLLWCAFLFGWVMAYANQTLDRAGLILGWILITPLVILLVLVLLDKI